MKQNKPLKINKEWQEVKKRQEVKKMCSESAYDFEKEWQKLKEEMVSIRMLAEYYKKAADQHQEQSSYKFSISNSQDQSQVN